MTSKVSYETLKLYIFLTHNVADENVMINIKTQQVKLIDFGSLTSIQRGQHVRTFYGTKKFCSPEALRGSYMPEIQEVWALGTLFYVLLFKMDPFKNDEEVLDLDISRRIERIRMFGINGQDVSISDAAFDALVKMLNKDWSQRPRVEQILQLPVFRL
jgi:serine/threonine protein kinase